MNRIGDHAEQIGQRLKTARLLKNLTQLQLAKAVGVAERVIKRMEAGENVTLSAFLAITGHLGYTDDILKVLNQDKPATIEQHQALAQGILQRRRRAR